MKIQAFHMPISKAGISDMIHLLPQHSEGQHIRCKLIVVLGDFIVKTQCIEFFKGRWWDWRPLAEGV